MCIGVNSVARKVKGMYVGANSVARKVKKGYIGVNGVAKLFYGKSLDGYYLEFDENINQLLSSWGGSYTASASSQYGSYAVADAFNAKFNTSNSWMSGYVDGTSWIRMTLTNGYSVKLSEVEAWVRFEHDDGALYGKAVGGSDYEKILDFTKNVHTTYAINSEKYYTAFEIRATTSTSDTLQVLGFQLAKGILYIKKKQIVFSHELFPVVLEGNRYIDPDENVWKVSANKNNEYAYKMFNYSTSDYYESTNLADGEYAEIYLELPEYMKVNPNTIELRTYSRVGICCIEGYTEGGTWVELGSLDSVSSTTTRDLDCSSISAFFTKFRIKITRFSSSYTKPGIYYFAVTEGVLKLE